MDFLQLAHERYSCKDFCSKQVDSGALRDILEAGRLAPTAKNNQPFHIYVVQNPDNLKKIDVATPCRYGAPTVVAVTSVDAQEYHYQGGKYSAGFEDVAIVATHMMLAAHDLGVDSCWLNHFDPDVVADLLQLSQGETLVMLLDLGYKNEGVEPRPNHSLRKSIDELVTFM